jgi:hypothetical protein
VEVSVEPLLPLSVFIIVRDSVERLEPFTKQRITVTVGVPRNPA